MSAIPSSVIPLILKAGAEGRTVYSKNDGDGDINSMKCNHEQSVTPLYIVTQQENGGHCIFVDLLSLGFTASHHFLRAQESLSESRIHSILPSESAQELLSNVDVALVIALDPFIFPATDSFPAVFSTVLGSSKRAGILGERCEPLGEKRGKDLPGLGR